MIDVEPGLEGTRDVVNGLVISGIKKGTKTGISMISETRARRGPYLPQGMLTHSGECVSGTRNFRDSLAEYLNSHD